MCAGLRVWLSAGVCVVWFAGRTVGDCQLPQHPAHGRHQPHAGDCVGADRPPACDGTPGTPTPEDWVLTVHCDPGYQHPDPSAADVPSVCTNGIWSIPQLSHCVIPDLLKNDRERCTVPEPAPNSQYRLLAEECGGDNLPSGSAVPHDCILFLNCAPGYRLRKENGDMFTQCSNKTWNPPIPNNLCIRSSDIVTGPEVTSQEHEKAEVTPGYTAVPLPASSSTGCVLPKASSYRKFCSLSADCDDCDFHHRRCLIPPGSRVDNFKVVCAPGYSIQTSYSGDIAVCRSNGWYPSNIPECLKQCHPLVSEQLLLFCQFGTNMVDCSQPALPNTTVTMKCRPSFSEYPNLKSQGAYRVTITCGQSGQWSENLPLCKPGCGVSKEVQTFSPTINNGTQAHIGFFPWHAGLYYPSENDGKVIWEQRCGGSLINDWVVLTAAHCVENVHTSGLRIALGKYYRSWDTYEPTEEKRNVSRIISPSQYTKNTFTFDIALVLLKEKIKLGDYIMPVCLDFDEGKHDILNRTLYVVGWGHTNVGEKSSETLLYNTGNAMTDDECRQAIPSFYTSFEKICILKNNSESATQGGDSGGGLTAVTKEGLHSIVGIVSTRYGRLSLFTKIKWKTNIDWIASGLAQLKNTYSS